MLVARRDDDASILALRKVCCKRLLVTYAFARTEEHVVVVRAVQHHDPSAIPLVGQPAVHELWYVGFWLGPSRQLDGVGDRPQPFLHPRTGAGMNPEDPRARWRSR